jgi:hypothetical protein
MQGLGDLLEIAARDHTRLCPRIILGARVRRRLEDASKEAAIC